MSGHCRKTAWGGTFWLLCWTVDSQVQARQET